MSKSPVEIVAESRATIEQIKQLLAASANDNLLLCTVTITWREHNEDLAKIVLADRIEQDAKQLAVVAIYQDHAATLATASAETTKRSMVKLYDAVQSQTQAPLPAAPPQTPNEEASG